MFAGTLALAIAAFFTGAAFYINFAEQPARLGIEDSALLSEWKSSYKRGFAMQAPLAMLGSALGILAYWLTAKAAFVAGALLLVANWPWTIFGIMPTNRILMATSVDKAGPASRALIVKWNKLHAVRTALGFLASLAFLLAVART